MVSYGARYGFAAMRILAQRMARFARRAKNAVQCPLTWTLYHKNKALLTPLCPVFVIILLQWLTVTISAPDGFKLLFGKVVAELFKYYLGQSVGIMTQFANIDCFKFGPRIRCLLRWSNRAYMLRLFFPKSNHHVIFKIFHK